PKNISNPAELSLLLLNDGQDLPKMPFDTLLNGLLEAGQIKPLLAVGIHAGKLRMQEYGTAKTLDYAGRGAKAEAYNQFVLETLIPFVQADYCIASFYQKAVAGFSLGGLTAIDMVWNYPDIFSIAGVFSGSLWWRTRDLDADYNEETDRIMHQQVNGSKAQSSQRFYFTTGSLDETADRNGNGIIDSIDDTQDLIKVLKKSGVPARDISYVNYEDGKHDVETWGRAMPDFLKWAWGRRTKTPIII
ncbi:MAG: hypothetical protein JWP88_1676, partial [Flaviaesturariibacter sp.]|nr:hypothetical protein [Flaviaesturariibacter sp.]